MKTAFAPRPQGDIHQLCCIIKSTYLKTAFRHMPNKFPLLMSGEFLAKVP